MKTKNPLLLSQALAQVHRPADLWRHREFRFLLIGAINTLFGYSLGVGLYLALVPRLHILFIGLTCNVLAITFSFTTYKLLVFRTRGNWLAEYLKSYVVYGASAVFAILFLWFLVDGLSMPIWIAQGLAILFTAVVSFLAHARFTFRRTLHHSTDV